MLERQLLLRLKSIMNILIEYLNLLLIPGAYLLIMYFGAKGRTRIGEKSPLELKVLGTLLFCVRCMILLFFR